MKNRARGLLRAFVLSFVDEPFDLDAYLTLYKARLQQSEAFESLSI